MWRLVGMGLESGKLFSELGILAFEGVCAFDGMGCIKRVSLELDGRCVGLVLARKPAGQ